MKGFGIVRGGQGGDTIDISRTQLEISFIRSSRREGSWRELKIELHLGTEPDGVFLMKVNAVYI
jgi:hypothetical protein